jgi:thiamine biosynthesis lipoprotein
MGGTGALPSPEAIAEARANVGMDLVELNAIDFTVRFARDGVMLDLGAIGKGYAIDQAAGLLREAGVTSAILHGGTSTIFALGHPPDAEAWKIALEIPGQNAGQPPSPLAVIPLHDEALSVSAIWGRAIRSGDKNYGHVIDPHTGEPVDDAVMAALVLPSATETDALSTALLTLGTTGLGVMTALRPAGRALIVCRADGGFRAESNGIAISA